MAKGDRITRSGFNAVQTAISNIMGLGSAESGYGQALASRPVNSGELITASVFNNLRTDIVKVWTHITNNAGGNAISDIYNATGGSSPPELKSAATGQVVVDLLSQYNTFIFSGGGVNAQKEIAAAAQMDSSTQSQTQRTTSWGSGGTQTVSHTITLTFNGYTSPTAGQGSLVVDGANHMRCFFNAGGSINISTSYTGGSSPSKDTDWAGICSNVGTLSVGLRNLRKNGSVYSSNGFVNISTSNVTLYQQFGSNSKYAENFYLLQVRRQSTNQLVFTVTFTDADTGDQTGLGAPVDEALTGTLTSTANVTRPFGSNVDIPAPAIAPTSIA